MRCRTNVAQKVPADYADQLHHFRQTIIRLREANGIDPSAIVNMDQTMCRFDMPRARTNDSRGKKTIWVKTTRAEKKGFTVALAAHCLWRETTSCHHFQGARRCCWGQSTPQHSDPFQHPGACYGQWLDDHSRVPPLAPKRLRSAAWTPCGGQLQASPAD